MPTKLFKKRRKFLIYLAKTLHQCGTPAYQLEGHLVKISEALELGGSFLISPTSITCVFWPKDDRENQEHSYIARVQPGDLDLGLLARTDELVEELCSGQRDLDDALLRLEDINNKPNPYPRWLIIIAFGLASSAFSMLMGTSWVDVIASFILAIGVYGLVMWGEKSAKVQTALEPFAAMAAAFGASAMTFYEPSINLPLVVLASIIVFIPGLALTVGLSELAARDLVSGTVRVMDALMVLFKLYFGAFLGFAIASVLFGNVLQVEAIRLPHWSGWLAVLVLSFCLMVMFKIRLKDAPWGIAAGFLGHGVSVIASAYFGTALGIFFAALALGIYANLFARWRKAPAAIVLLQGIVVLVPGSKLYMGLNTVISGKEILHIEQLGSQSFLILMSLVAGLIFANIIADPRRSL
jgi:uncharacterized membrane protein YjjP (DUF1212 family)|tara:strand:+ start:856 stop:2085 length:1230 start_codon:yes stop_codon:yes gene_type:complete